MKYRKKPVTIDAIQFDGNNIEDIKKFVTNKHLTILEDGTFEIPTLEGNMKATVGDYIIRGVHEEYYPCKPDIFNETYESIDPLRNVSKAITTDFADAKLNTLPKKYYKGKIFHKHSFDDIRDYLQRGRNGYCLTDVWNINSWFLETLSHMLSDLLIGGVSYPGRDDCDTFEKWQSILQRMKYCCEEALEPTAEKNEWEDTFDLNFKCNPIDPETNFGTVEIVCDNEENHQKYLKRQSEIDAYQQDMQKEALELFVRWFNDLWD